MTLRREMSLVELWVASQPSTRQHKFFRNELDIPSAISQCENLRSQISERSAGFLEVCGDKTQSGWLYSDKRYRPLGRHILSPTASPLVVLHRLTSVRFVHRTARDFAQKALESPSSPGRALSDDEMCLLVITMECNLWLLDPRPMQFSLVTTMNVLREFRTKGSNISPDTFGKAIKHLSKFDARLLKATGPGTRDTIYRYSGYPVAQDFLGAMIEEGEEEYVVQQVRSSSPNPGELNYLLACATHDMVRRKGWALVEQFLQKGADPNATCISQFSGGEKRSHCISPWHHYLSLLPRLVFLMGESNSLLREHNLEQQIRTFLTRGASLDGNFPLCFHVQIGDHSYCSWGDTDDALDYDVTIAMTVTPTFLLRWCFGPNSWFVEIEKEFGLAEHGRHAEVTMVGVREDWFKFTEAANSRHLLELIEGVFNANYEPPVLMETSDNGSDSQSTSGTDAFDDVDDWKPQKVHDMIDEMRRFSDLIARGKETEAGLVHDPQILAWTEDNMRQFLDCLKPWGWKDAEIIKDLGLPASLFAWYNNDTWTNAAVGDEEDQDAMEEDKSEENGVSENGDGF